MDFERTFIGVSYGLVTTAFLAVALSGEIGWVAPSVFAICLIVSFFRSTDGPLRPATSQIWTAFLFVAFATLIIWSASDGNWLLHALEFALLMTISRLFQRRFAKDYLQLYVLTFLLMLVAAVIHPSLTFALSFLVYTVLAIWGLTMVHLVRDIEIQTRTGPEHLLPPAKRLLPRLPWRRKAAAAQEAVLPESPLAAETLAWRRRRLIGGGFLVVSSLMALGVLLGSMVFFFLFPRLGMGFFFAQTRGSQAVVGFSDEVELGNFGKLKSSAQVVMRVRFPDEPKRLHEPLRIRGLSFDRWQGRRWTRLGDADWELLHRGDRYGIPRQRRVERAFERTWMTEIYLEPIDSDVKVLFSPPRTQWVEFLDSQYDSLRGRRKAVRQAASGDLSFKAPLDTAVSYRAQSVEFANPALRAALLSQNRGKSKRWIRDRWTELPANLDPRIAALATRLSANASGRFAVATAIERALRKDWEYSLEGDQDPDAPLNDFLFGSKRGHCEYFATAMALMLRTLGHPARVVNGFYGGEYNGFGAYRMIRQGDAHSWVEVHFPRRGWRTFEPTPPSGQLARFDDGLLSSARRLVDGAAMLWYTWVVEYDLERQVAMFRDVGRALRRLGGGLRLSGSSANPADQAEAPEASKHKSALPWAQALAILTLLALLIWAARRWWLSGQAGRPGYDRRLVRVARRVDRELVRLGLARLRWQTWQLMAAPLGELDDGTGAAMTRFAQAWDAARFTPEPAESLCVAAQAAGLEVAQQLRQLRRRNPAARASAGSS